MLLEEPEISFPLPELPSPLHPMTLCIMDKATMRKLRSRSIYILMAVLVVLIVFLFRWSRRDDKLMELNPELPQGTHIPV